MRALTAKQRLLIDQWFDQHWTGPGSLYCYDQIPKALAMSLQMLNDYETIWQDIDRYINDKACEIVYGRNKQNKR